MQCNAMHRYQGLAILVQRGDLSRMLVCGTGVARIALYLELSPHYVRSLSLLPLLLPLPLPVPVVNRGILSASGGEPTPLTTENDCAVGD